MVDDRDDGSSDDNVSPPATKRGVVPVRARTDPAVAATAAVSADLAPTAAVSAELAATAARDPDSRSAATVQLERRPRRESGVPLEIDGSRYRLGELLGRGGMGEVVVAFDEQIGREVAVKRIRAAEPSGEELARFVREARVQGRLEHPAVVPVHDLAVDRDGKPFFVMKRLSGTVMSELLTQLRLGESADLIALRRRLLRALVDVCLAIELAHSKGVVHRDLKPSNVMLGDFGEVYVLDWGIARLVTEPDDSGVVARPSQSDLKLDTGDTRVGTVLGTPAYMAPEQLAGERAGTAADVYALGCILYEIVAGEPLHRSARSLASAMTADPARPSSVRPDAPPELDALCAHATQVEPAARLPSARALGDAVQAFLDGDRDIAVRRELARGHLAEAQAAIARGDDENNRKAAMAAAGRALALDPTTTAAADLITSLVLRPPAELPAEVAERLVRIDIETGRSQGRLAALAMIGYLGFVPLLLWTGVQDNLFIVAFAALAVISGMQVWAMTRGNTMPKWRIYLSAALNATLIGLICRMVGPFIIAPTLVATTFTAYAAHPKFGRIGFVAAILAASVVVPWVLELAGVLSSTYSFEKGRLVLHSSILTFSAVPVQLAFAVLLVALLAVVALLTRTTARRQREAARQVELQAWHLRQLVPTGSVSAPS